MAESQVALEIGDLGIVLDQLLPDQKRCLEGRQCFGWLSHLPEQKPNVVVAGSQLGLEIVDSGVRFSQPLLNAASFFVGCHGVLPLAHVRQDITSIEMAECEITPILRI